MGHLKRLTLVAALLIPVFHATAQQPPPTFPEAEINGAPSAASQPSLRAPELVVDGKVVGKPVKPEAGEICLVCSLPIDSNQLAYLVDGQRVAVHRGNCIRILQSNPGEWLARLKTHGAFLGAVPEHSPLSNAVFFAGLYVLLGLIFAALSAHRAFHAGHSALAWFGLGFLFNVAAYLVLRARPPGRVAAPGGVPGGLGKIASTFSPEPCPRCGATNHPSAAQCLGCGAKLQPKFRSEVEKAGLSTV